MKVLNTELIVEVPDINLRGGRVKRRTKLLIGQGYSRVATRDNNAYGVLRVVFLFFTATL